MNKEYINKIFDNLYNDILCDFDISEKTYLGYKILQNAFESIAWYMVEEEDKEYIEKFKKILKELNNLWEE